MMRYIIIGIIILLSSQTVEAQTAKYEFCPEGARWVYQESNPTIWPTNFFNVYVYERDSILDNQPVKIIREDLMYSSGPADPEDPIWRVPDLDHPDNRFIRNHYIYQSEDSLRVYFYDKGEFRPLYDFSLDSADIFIVYNYDYHICEPVDSVYVIVDDIIPSSIGLKVLRASPNTQYFSSAYEVLYYIGGLLRGMFPDYYYLDNPNCGSDIWENNDIIPYAHLLTCYSDNVGALSYYGQFDNCPDIFNVLLSDEESISALTLLDIYPNPASDKITIELDSENIEEIYLTDINGRIHALSSLSAHQFKLPELPYGAYILKVITSTEIYVSKLIISNP